MMVSCASVTLLSPRFGEEIALYRKDYRECINERKVKKYGEIENMAFPEAVRFKWQPECVGEAWLDISEQENFAEIARCISVADTDEAEIFNLKTGTRYFWRIRSSAGTSRTSCFKTGDGTPRIIRMTPPYPINIRDIGGKEIPGVGRVRQGLVYRGSEINEVSSGKSISAENLAVMRDVLKIRTDLDLRYPVQVGGMTASPLGSDVRYIHIPVNAYNSFTEEQNKLFSAAIRVFAEPANYPVYVHCAGGADRTGEIIYLLEQLLGVPQEESLVEYEMTSLSVYPRPREIQYFVKWRDSIAAIGGKDVSPGRQVENYLKSIGITDAEIAAIRKMLIEKTVE